LGGGGPVGMGAVRAAETTDLRRRLAMPPGVHALMGPSTDGGVLVSKLKPLREQVVVVMGASSGIGREAAGRFAAEGAAVVLSGRSLPALASLADELTAAGGRAVAVPAEVTDPAQVRAVADRAVAEFGRLDTWVHLPGVSVYAPVEDISPEEFRRVVDVTLLGQVYGAMAALPHLRREGRGALVHVTSVVARRAFPLQSAYSAAKRGVEGFLESLRVELAHDGVPIRVTNVMPAAINTPFFDKARTRLGVKPAAVPPVYAPKVVADAILFAAEHGPRDIVAGGGAKAIMAAQALSPRLVDAFLARTGYNVQHTDEPKTEDEPDALFTPVETDRRVEDGFDAITFDRSLGTWLATHPPVRAGLTVAALAGAAAAGLRLRGRRARGTRA
jgi:NAD(P)-dependent dehydrogenase (short-subunit alcohol dehydrogenase family)